MPLCIEEQLEIIWTALHSYREDCIAGDEHDDEWSDICLAMAVLREDHGLPAEVDLPQNKPEPRQTFRIVTAMKCRVEGGMDFTEAYTALKRILFVPQSPEQVRAAIEEKGEFTAVYGFTQASIEVEK